MDTKKTYNLSSMPLRRQHYWIVSVASLGQLIGTAVATIAGIIIPMINIIRHPELSSLMQGLIGAADLIGICIGSAIFGNLIDRFGYLFFFRFCPTLICVASTISIFVPDIAVLTICLFLVGVGIGGEYSLDSGYVSELMPDRYKSTMVGVTKTASSLGNIIAAAISLWCLFVWEKATDWPKLMWIITAISGLMIAVRIKFYESPVWLVSKGKINEAQSAVKKFLGSDVELDIDPTSTKSKDSDTSAEKMNYFKFVISNWKRVIVSGVPWACEGLGVYGIGVFLPILVMALGLEHFAPGESNIFHVTSSVKITLYISCIILPGFIAGLLLIKGGKRITTIQTIGFLLCTVALCVLMPAYKFHWNKWIAIGAFMAFEFFLNMGPHLVTYVLPPHIYNVSDRGRGVGLAASIGKIGAIIGVFLIPILLDAGGAELVLGVSAGVMALGAAITLIFRKTVIDSGVNEPMRH